MKNLLIIAIALTSVDAFATRARMAALGNSIHLVDTVTVFDRPTDLFALGTDYVTLETGLTTTTTTQNQNAEGMIVRTMGDAKLGLALGHQSLNASAWGLRKAAMGVHANLGTNQQNPVSIMYAKKSGDISWAGTFGFSSYNNKGTAVATDLQKEDSMGFNVGATSGAWDATLSSGLANNASLVNGTKMSGTKALTLAGGYKMDSMYWFGKYTTAGIKVESSAGAELLKYDTTIMNVGVANSHKKDGSELFYSIAYNNSEAKTATATDTATTLPITIGFEADASSWLTLRGAVSQSSIINKSKTEISTTTELDPGANSTTVSAGAGLKFNKLTLDGTFSKLHGSTATQALNGNDLLTQVGMTYVF